MTVSSSFCGQPRFSPEEVVFPLDENNEVADADFGHEAPPKRIRGLLKEAGLTVARLSSATRQAYGHNTHYFIPPAFLYKVNHGISPHICQIAALSEITGHRFNDCLEACGFDLRLILPMQLKVHHERTVLLTPMGSLSGLPISSASHNEFRPGRYLFARIGSRDATFCSRLVPGSVIRIDRQYVRERLRERDADAPLWLVEHSHGRTCCHVKQTDEEHIILLPARPPFSAWPLRLVTEARILGQVDLQIPPGEAPIFRPKARDVIHGQHFPLSNRETRTSFSSLVRVSRSRTGLTLRTAREMTLRVARILGKPEYSIALGLLSDYEAMEKLPRSIAKIITLCIVYSIDFWELLRTAGIGIDYSGKASVSSVFSRTVCVSSGQTRAGSC